MLRGGNILPLRLCLKDDDIFIPCTLIKENILLKKNDIVTPAVTSLENIGKMARVESNIQNTTVGGFVFILRPYFNDDAVSKYLLTAMSAPYTIEFMKSKYRSRISNENLVSTFTYAVSYIHSVLKI